MGIPDQRLAAGMAAILVAAAASAEPTCPARAVEEAREAYGRLELELAVRATAGVEECPDGSAAELAEALRWRGQALAANDDAKGATAAFAALSAVSPDYSLDPNVSPKVHALFEAGRAKARAERVLFARAVAAPPGQVAVEVYDAASRGIAVSFRFRVAGQSVEVPAVRGAERYTAAVPRRAKGTFVAVLRAGSRVIQTTAAAALPPAPPEDDAPLVEAPEVRPAAGDAPLAAAPPLAPPLELAKDEPPLAPSPEPGGWKVYAAVGGGVAVVAAAVAVAVMATRPRPLEGSLGRIEVEAR